MESNKDNNRRGASSHIANQSSIFSYITEQLPHPEIIVENWMSHPHDMDEREMEKKRIREEIIMLEIARRRVLEAEVRRELLMERQLAMRGLGSSSLMGLNERPNDSGGFEITPFQTHTAGLRVSEMKPVVLEGEGEEKKKIILLAKPDGNTVGTKRKASPPPPPPPEVDNASELSSKKVKKELTCAICQISTTCEQGLQDHFRGKKHKSKEVALTFQKTRQNFSIGLFPKKPIEPCSVVQSNDLSLVKENEPFDGLWCDLCKIGVTSHGNMEAHKKGKRHVVRLLGSSQKGGPGPSGNKDMDIVNHEEVVEEGKSVTSESVAKALDDVEQEARYSGAGSLGKEVSLDEAEPQDEEAANEMEGGDVAKVEVESKIDFDEEIAGLLLGFNH